MEGPGGDKLGVEGHALQEVEKAAEVLGTGFGKQGGEVW